MTTSMWKHAVATAAAIVLFAGAYAGIAYAGQRGQGGPGMGMGMRGPGGPGGPMGEFMGRMGEQLGITDAQKQQIKSIMDQNRDAVQPLMKAAGDAREALMDAATGGADQGTLQDKANALGAAEAQMALAHAKIQQQIFTQVLTPDQQQKALQLRDQMRQHMQQRRGPGGAH